MLSTNIEMLQTVAIGLKHLKDEVVFVGGSVAELYVMDPAASDIRPTLDVDCVIELGSRIAFNELENNMRAIGFENDKSPRAPICRWVYKDIKVDLMPTDEAVLGFTNIWYPDGINHKIIKTLPNGVNIFVFDSVYYLASKFEAHKSRGGSDLRQSHDFEDIIYIMDNCSTVLDDINNSHKKVQDYLKNEYSVLLKNPNITEGVESALPYGTGEEGTEIIIDLMESIIEIN